MTYKEFNKTSKKVSMEYNRRIKELQHTKDNELWELEKQYIAEHRKYQNGEIVIVKGFLNEYTENVITSAGILCGGEIGYRLNCSYEYTPEHEIVGKANEE